MEGDGGSERAKERAKTSKQHCAGSGPERKTQTGTPSHSDTFKEDGVDQRRIHRDTVAG